MCISTSDYSNNGYDQESLHLLNSPLIGPSTFSDDEARQQLLRRTVLALLPAKSTNLLRLLTGGQRGGYDEENRSDKRAGYYMRFGKKPHSQQSKRMGYMARSYLNSFGSRDKKPDGVFMRFGRSLLADRNTDDVITPSENEAADANHTKNDGSSVKEMNWKRFMRFGRVPSAAEKQKRFMRFGRAHEKDGLAVEDPDEPSNTRFSRVILLSEPEAGQQKRFMRFGRDLRRKRLSMPNPDLQVEPKQTSIVRDESADANLDDISDQAKAAKRFMRFGKRPNDEGNHDNTPIAASKRFMRFGKRTRNIDNISPKRFMRFGKRPYSSKVIKRFMRFGKRSSLVAMK